jgi:AcrR family transcriptional regulator
VKISKDKQIENKEKIMLIAVELIAENGFKKTSMSKIAKKAKIGEATIYNYFPTKEHIVYEYYYYVQKETKKRLLELKEFSDMSLKEQIQTLFDTELEIMSNHRTFIQEVFEQMLYKSIFFQHETSQKGDEELIMMVEELLDISIEAGEIEEINFSRTLQYLFLDYFFGIVYYWLKDESEFFDNTTIMIDKSLDVIYAVLQSGLITKVESLFSFVVKTHILSLIKPPKRYKKRNFR